MQGIEGKEGKQGVEAEEQEEVQALLLPQESLLRYGAHGEDGYLL